MKLITVQFEDSVDISNFLAGKTGVTLTDGTNTLPGGIVLADTKVMEVPPVLVPHSHELIIGGSAGPAIPD